MKKIDSIIRRLKNGEDIPPNERRIAGLLLEEMRLQEKHNDALVLVEMSPEMFRWFMANAYDRDLNLKPGLFEKPKFKFK